jgi:hypothetical protein
MDTAMTEDDARHITQDFFDRQGEALVAGDNEAGQAFWDLPCTLENMDRRTVVATPEDMQAIFDCFVRQMQSQQLTDMVRTCREVTAKDPTTIWATYETRFIRDGKFLSDLQYTAFVVLRMRDDRWKASTLQMAVDNPLSASLSERAAMQELV